MQTHTIRKVKRATLFQRKQVQAAGVYSSARGVILYWWCSYYVIKKVWIILISNYELWKREKTMFCWKKTLQTLWEISHLAATNLSYLGVVYEVDIFKIFRRSHRSVKNVASFYPRSWRIVLYKINIISKSHHGLNREPQWAACIPTALRWTGLP